MTNQSRERERKNARHRQKNTNANTSEMKSHQLAQLVFYASNGSWLSFFYCTELACLSHSFFSRLFSFRQFFFSMKFNRSITILNPNSYLLQCKQNISGIHIFTSFNKLTCGCTIHSFFLSLTHIQSLDPYYKYGEYVRFETHAH